MAEGRTRMCGSTLLSILRRSRGRSEYWRVTSSVSLRDVPIAPENVAYLGNQLTLAEFSVHKGDVPILIKLGASQLQLVAGFDFPAAQPETVIEEARQGGQIILEQLATARVAGLWPEAAPEAFAADGGDGEGARWLRLPLMVRGRRHT